MSNGIVAENELLHVVQGELPSPEGVLSIFTGCVWWTTWNEFSRCMESDDVERCLGRLLEIRAYDAKSEYHAQRSAMGVPFVGRFVCDDDFEEDEKLDDFQLLDKDDALSKGVSYVTTGGGSYTLPIVGAERIHIRNYLEYGKDDGMASIVDFRIVGLEGGQNG